MQIKFKYIIVVLLIWGSSVRAQDPESELKKIRNNYLVNTSISFDVEVYSFDSPVDRTPELVSKGRTVRDGDNQYTKFLEYEMLSIGLKTLLIDHSEKTIEMYDYSDVKDKIKNVKGNMAGTPDSLFNITDSVVMHPVENGTKHFTIYQNNSAYISSEIYVDEKTNFIKRIVNYYKQEGEDDVPVYRVDVYYKNISVTGPKVFPGMKTYVKETGGKCEPAEKFKNYRVEYFNYKS